jgi:hypothetical protein
MLLSAGGSVRNIERCSKKLPSIDCSKTSLNADDLSLIDQVLLQVPEVVEPSTQSQKVCFPEALDRYKCEISTTVEDIGVLGDGQFSPFSQSLQTKNKKKEGIHL